MRRLAPPGGILAATLLIGVTGAAAPMGQQETPYELEALYRSGVVFDQFLEAADQRREAWRANYADGSPAAEAVERVRAVGAAAKLLVVAEDWCGDSVHTIPYLARLVEAIDGLEMRIIDSEVGAQLMRQRPTPDGRAATPTVVVLDTDYAEIGSWVERPGVLQDWFLDNEDELSRAELYDRKYAWYAEDAGDKTIDDITALLERAFGTAQ